MTSASSSSASERTPSGRVLSIVLAVVLVLLLGRFAVLSLVEIHGDNDFEVFYGVGEVAAAQDDGVYEFISPVLRLGPFLYPPSAAVFFVPLASFSVDVAAVLFTIAKLACIVALFLGTLRLPGVPAVAGVPAIALVTITGFILFRPFNNDVGNGQVNIFVAAAALGGIWWMMRSRGWGWGGATLLAFAIAFKLTPILLVAVPLLAGRLKAVAATVIMTVILLVALPAAWFGPHAFVSMSRTYVGVMDGHITEPRDLQRQLTINSMIQFTAAQIRADPADYIEEGGKLYREIDGVRVHTRVPEGMSKGTAKAIWFVIGLSIGAAFLGYWWWLRRNGFSDWTWNLAMLCVLSMLLPPQVRKAHLVILIVPTAWLVVRLAWLCVREGGLIEALRAHRVLFLAFGLYTAGMMASDDLPLPAPGFPLPYRASVFAAMVLLVVALVVAARTITRAPALRAALAPEVSAA